jgi:tetratricopeptide (TPR) repeat protein
MLAMKSNVQNSLGRVPEAIALEEQAWTEVQPVLKGPKSNRWMQIATYCFFHAVYQSLDGQYNMADPSGALLWVERAENLLLELGDTKPEFKVDPKYVTALENTRMAKAWYLHQLRRDAEARALYEAQYAVVEANKNSESLEIEKHRRDLRAAYADFLIDMGEFDRAAQMASILMPYRESHVQPGDDTWDKIDIASELCRAAIIAFHQGRTADAMRAMNQSLEMNRELRKKAPDYEILHAQYVMNLVSLAQTPQVPPDNAKQMFEEALKVAGEFTATHPTVLSAQILEARSYIGLARLAQHDRRTQDQQRELDQALAILQRVAAERPKAPEPHELLAVVQSLRDHPN